MNKLLANSILIGVGVSQFLLPTSGCRRAPVEEKQVEEDADDRDSAPLVVRLDDPREPAMREAQMPVFVDAQDAPVEIKPRGLDRSEVPFSVCAVTTEKSGQLKVGVVANDGSSALLRRGDMFMRYELESYDFDRDAAVFYYQGEQVMVSFGASAVPSGSEVGSSVGEKEAFGGNAEASIDMRSGVDEEDQPRQEIKFGGPPPGRIDLTHVDNQNLQPTEEEKKQNIDVNDPETWPEGYRGPVIERLIKLQKDAGIEPEESPIPFSPNSGE